MIDKPKTKSKELLYLSLVVTLTIGFSLFYIVINLLDSISGYLREYATLPLSRFFAQGVLVYLTVLLWVLYRYWRRALTLQRELEDIISSINPDTLLVLNQQNRIAKCNYSVNSMFGYEAEELLGRPASLLIPETDCGEGTVDGPVKPGQREDFSLRISTGRKKNGEELPLEIIMANLNGGTGKVILLRDITERKKSEEELRALTAKLGNANEHLSRLVNIDPLTEVLNRRGLERSLKDRREGCPITAILLDLDNFKQVNDTLGHAEGDLVLKEVAKRLRVTLRTTDTVARVGGDEFLVLFPETRWAEVMAVAERLRQAISASRLPVGFEAVAVTASMGVASLPVDVSTVEEILSLTRAPLQKSKRQGKNQVSAVGEGGGEGVEDAGTRGELVKRLLHDNCFYPLAQPIYQLANHDLVGYELLTRSVIEEIKMPVDLFRFTLENNILAHVDLRCLRSCMSVASQFEPSTRLHVNLFPSTLLATPVDTLVGMLDRAGNRRTVCVEISEQQFIGQPSYLKEHIIALKEAGVLVAIDDLGYGRSSLESLILLEPDIVKIDRVYIDGVAASVAKRRSLERMLKMIWALGAEEIAEGIESGDDLAVLKDIGVRYGQGYLLGEPRKVQPQLPGLNDLNPESSDSAPQGTLAGP